MCCASFHKLERIFSPFLYGGKKLLKKKRGGGMSIDELKEK